MEILLHALAVLGMALLAIVFLIGLFTFLGEREHRLYAQSEAKVYDAKIKLMNCKMIESKPMSREQFREFMNRYEETLTPSQKALLSQGFTVTAGSGATQIYMAVAP